jgi:hypothetical protein
MRDVRRKEHLCPNLFFPLLKGKSREAGMGSRGRLRGSYFVAGMGSRGSYLCSQNARLHTQNAIISTQVQRFAYAGSMVCDVIDTPGCSPVTALVQPEYAAHNRRSAPDTDLISFTPVLEQLSTRLKPDIIRLNRRNHRLASKRKIHFLPDLGSFSTLFSRGRYRGGKGKYAEGGMGSPLLLGRGRGGLQSISLSRPVFGREGKYREAGMGLSQKIVESIPRMDIENSIRFRSYFVRSGDRTLRKDAFEKAPLRGGQG